MDSCSLVCQERHDEGSTVAQENMTQGGMLTHYSWAQTQFMGTDCLASMLLTDSVSPLGNVPFSMDMKYILRVESG